MKKIYTLLFAFGILILSNETKAQTADDPIHQNSVQSTVNQNNLKATPTQSAPFQMGTPSCSLNVISTTSGVCDSGTVSFTASGTYCYEWFNGDTTLVGSGDTYTTPTLFNDSIFYVEGKCPDTSITIPMPAQSGTFGSSVRGYWFQAPSDFTILGFWVPTDVGATQLQNVAIVKLPSAPPLFSAVTNTFSLEGYWPNFPAGDTMWTCIPVTAGEFIGVLGCRGTTNSYAPSPSTSSINGTPITLTRLGMQFPLNTTSPQDLWQESGGSISRVEFFYSPTMTSTGLQVAPAGIYSSYNGVLNPSICQGDSLLIGGNYETTTGTYVTTDTTVDGCDSIVAHNLTVNALPTVSIDPFVDDTVCTVDGVITLPSGTPVAGSYSGTGVSGTVFDPSMSGSGTHDVFYTYTDTLTSCMASASTTITVLNCTGVNEMKEGYYSVYPNPANDILVIELNDYSDVNTTIDIFDISGRKVITESIDNNLSKIMINTSALSKGTYLLVINNGLVEQQFKLLIE